MVVRKIGSNAYQAGIGIALATALLLVWTNLAVGLIGSENEPVNLMYTAVLAVGIVGTIIARFRPVGMARALFAAALAQALIAVIALVAGMHQYPGASVSEILNVNGFFVALFVLAALFFQRAALERK